MNILKPFEIPECLQSFYLNKNQNFRSKPLLKNRKWSNKMCYQNFYFLFWKISKISKKLHKLSVKHVNLPELSFFTKISPNLCNLFLIKSQNFRSKHLLKNMKCSKCSYDNESLYFICQKIPQISKILHKLLVKHVNVSNLLVVMDDLNIVTQNKKISATKTGLQC